MTPRIVPDGREGRAVAVAALRDGGIVAVPTDTVYGIAVALGTPGGIEALYRAKRRPPERGIVLLLADAGQAGQIGVMSPAASRLADAFWPGGLTLVVDRATGVQLPEVLAGGADTIGLRVPDHDAPRALAAALGPLPTTSANRSGEPECRTAAEIAERLGDDIGLILDGGAARGGPPSTVVDCSGPAPRILRPGAIEAERIAAALEPIGVRLAPPIVGS